MAPLDGLVQNAGTNAAIGWLSAGVLGLVVLWSVLTGVRLWVAFGAAVLAVVAFPALWTRDWTAVVPWPVVVVATLATVVGIYGWHAEVAGYVALVAVAFTAAVELDAFTAVRMSRRFAAGFAVLAAMALQGWWIVVQFVADRWVGTDFLTTQTELQWDIVAVTAVGLLVSGGFALYFDHVEHAGLLPTADPSRQP